MAALRPGLNISGDLICGRFRQCADIVRSVSRIAPGAWIGTGWLYIFVNVLFELDNDGQLREVNVHN